VGVLAFNFTVVGDTTSAPPAIVSVVPTANDVPGASTNIAVDFSKAIVPSTVTATSFRVYPAGAGNDVAGVFSFLNGQKRVVFDPAAFLASNTIYVIELTAGITDNAANPLSNPGSFTFTTAPPPPLALTAIQASAATVGAPVVLSGTGFDPALAGNVVRFTGAQVTPSAGDAGALQVIVPAGAQTGPIKVFVDGDSTNALTFTVLTPVLDPVNELVNVINVPSSGQSIAVLPNGARAYMTSPGANTVVPIELPAGGVLQAIPVGLSPFGVAASPSSDRVYVSNFFSNTVSVIDAVPSHGTYHQVIATIPTGPNPTGLAVHPDGRTLYVALYGAPFVDCLDTDSTSASVYSAKASISTGSTSKSVAVEPDGAFAVVLTDDGTLWLIDIRDGVPDEQRAKASISTGSTSKSVAVEPDGAFVYVTTDDGQVLVYSIVELGGSGATPQEAAALYEFRLVDTIVVGENPDGMAFDVNSGLLIVVNSGDNTLSFINYTDIPSDGLMVSVDVDPNTLNVGAKGKWITAALQFPRFLDPHDLDVSSVLLNQTVHAVVGQSAFTDKNGDGILEHEVKFRRDQVQAVLPQGERVNVHITGVIDGVSFFADDVIRVRHPDVLFPNAGATVGRGTPTVVRWVPMRGASVHHVDILVSADGGESWNPVITGTEDDSSYVWTPPNVAATACHVMIVARDDRNQAVGIGMSGMFAIGEAVTGVEEPLPARFAFLPAAPNPFAARTHVRFDLAEPGRVTLKVFALDGSLVRTLADGASYPAGHHAVIWDGRDDAGRAAPAGVYFAHVHAGSHEGVQKLVRAGR
jgi:YVTN family beta-propeller protein